MKAQMKSKVILISASLFLLFTAGNVNAQRYGRQAGPGFYPDRNLPDSTRVDRMVERMAVDLELTGKQAEKIREIHYARVAEVRKQRAEMRKQAAEHRKEMDETREKVHEDVLAVLTDDQKEEFENLRPRIGRGEFGPRGPHHRNFRGKGPGRRGGYCPYR